MYTDFVKQLEDYLFVENTPVKADIIFVPGNGYPQMAERAAQLYAEGYAPVVLPSGKYSVTAGKFSGVLAEKEKYKDKYETEWDFLNCVLQKNGVPVNAIKKENQATFTYENAIYSRQVTDREHITVKKAILCCKNYHARRALLYYQLLFPETEFYVCSSVVDGITKDNWKMTEEGVEAVTGEITRIIRQFSLMLEKK